VSDWLYQVRIRVSERLSESLRSGRHIDLANNLDRISNDHGMSLVCTYDAFKGYCDEAEENGIEKYALYDWTRATIENPEKKAKHLKSFAFYRGFEQVYEKELALSLEEKLLALGLGEDLLEVKVIDSNPGNNPQPPSSNQQDSLEKR
tara:strand:+ start:1546 stop:1989 length:444 start_codon:yes stop_codon:yes gene_type:complete